MRPIIYYTMYAFNIVFLVYDNVCYDNYTVIESLFREQHLYKRFYQTFLIGV
jgi:hypothetical protein